MLDRITISGIDDSVDSYKAIMVSKRFPFVEWGILVSEKNQGKPRYPSEAWRHRAFDLMNDCMSSLHLCGKASRSFFEGTSDPFLDDVLTRFTLGRYRLLNLRRVQVNGFAAYADQPDLLERVVRKHFKHSAGLKWILQCPTPKEIEIVDKLAVDHDLTCLSALMDPSGGKGKEASWLHDRTSKIDVGYAGGVSPSNITEALFRININFRTLHEGRNTWIDMESRVRSEDDKQLDPEKVKRVLKACEDTFDIFW